MALTDDIVVDDDAGFGVGVEEAEEVVSAPVVGLRWELVVLLNRGRQI